MIETKNLKGTNKCVRKRKLNSKDYKHCLEVTQLESKINQLEKSLRKYKEYRKEVVEKVIKNSLKKTIY